MKKYLAFVCTILLVSGCEKIHDHILADPTAEMKLCTIQSFHFHNIYDMEDSLVFTYNALANPVSITRVQAGSGFPNYLFKYDKRQRLTDFIGMYAFNNGAEFWHKYFYDNKGRIVMDSIYSLCHISNGMITDFVWSYRILYDYDSQNRIIRDSVNSTGGPYPSVHHYSYDANGNRTGGTYDKKIHFRRTNKIWMFLDRDYSVNNPFIATSYNGYALPTEFDLPSKTGQLTFLGNYFSSARIRYSCR